MSALDITYSYACTDPALFGPWFGKPSWSTWQVLDKALFGEPLSPAELIRFTELTGRATAPTAPADEAWIIAGRRSGKDVKAASIAVYMATIAAAYFNYAAYLTPGERGIVQLLAVDRVQAQICLSYLKAMFEQPFFKRFVEKEQSDGLDLNNGLSIEITTNDKRRVRGRTVICAILDEVAFWLSSDTGSVNPDKDVYDALKPAMATIPGAMLIGISSPYAKRGLLWNKYRTHYGQPTSRTLIVKAPTWIMNPSLSRHSGFIADAFAEDPQAAAAEFGAEFRSDVAGFLEHEVIQQAVNRGVRERAPDQSPRGDVAPYVAFVDPSGGSRDAMTLAIAHLDPVRNIAVLDVAHEVRPPFKPADVVADFAKTILAYGIDSCIGDRYAGEWVVSAFEEVGISYEHSERNRSEIYLELLPAMNQGRVVLLDIPRLASQLGALERRTSRSGRDTVDHMPGAHDDLANAAAGALVLALDGAAEAGDEDGGVMRIGFGNDGFRLIASPRSPIRVPQAASTDPTRPRPGHPDYRRALHDDQFRRRFGLDRDQ